MKKAAFLLAAPSSGAGKTTTTLGLLRALHNKGISVQAFKSGPDYIDTKFHELATESPSVNLDMFFCDNTEIQRLFEQYSSTKQAAVIEGVMGLFDGYNQQKGSSAELAKMLDLPVILVVNGKSVAYSMAALLYGYKNFDKNVKIAGVIFNRVSTESHYNILKDAAHSVGLESFGYIPQKDEIEIPSRHLGLNIDKKYRFKAFADNLAKHIQKYVDIDLILTKTQKDFSNSVTANTNKKQSKIRIGIAQDEAFNFMYVENIRKLEDIAEIFFFSPMKDTELPQVDYLYLPGGYPEFFLEELCANTKMKNAIKDFAEAGGHIWAECGGMLYLCKEMIDEAGIAYPLANVLNLTGSMQTMKLKLGYRQFCYNDLALKGHEFHYSTLLPNSEKSIAQLYSAKQMPIPTQLIRYKNTIAGYTHIYWGKGEDFLNVFK